MNPEELSLRPYARLLTMLGDQLIKNERIALVELIKNAYDADADHVEIRFEDFNEDMTCNNRSRIVVLDDGLGMTLDTVRTQWMNPAAPQKYLDKRRGRGKTLGKKRVIQGEKGIGRFAVLKLGKIITVTTRPYEAKVETILHYDFGRFDNDFLEENGQPREIFLDQIRIHCSQTEPTRIPGDQHGTVIEIQKLKGKWNNNVIKRLCRDVSDLTDPVSRITRREASDIFAIDVFCNGERRSVEAEQVESLKALIEDKPVVQVEGGYCSENNAYFYDTGHGREDLSLHDPKVTGLWVWRQHFGTTPDIATTKQEYICGDFEFHFYIFDFSRGIDGRHALTQPEKDLLKGHRIYLYRDNVRVYPYGDPDDDWLGIDVKRGTGRAGNFFSNDQVIGWIDITHKGNPHLRDKTNREGLIETGGAAEDLIFLVQVLLSYLQQYLFARHQQKQRQRNKVEFVRDRVVTQRLESLRTKLLKSQNNPLASDVATITETYEHERTHLLQRAEMIEDLAGVGLSVEMASHDIMLLMDRAQEIGNQIQLTALAAGDAEIRRLVDTLSGVMNQIASGMRDLQSIFKSSRRRRKVLDIVSLLDKIQRVYQSLMDQRGIRYEKVRINDTPLEANTTDAVVMQVLINLFDNSCYWLSSVAEEKRQISVTIDGTNNELIFSDTGPGIDPADLPYIFEVFYSGKGQDGRGLGLYIARQLLERHDYRISVAEKHQQVLSGANFVVGFAKEGA